MHKKGHVGHQLLSHVAKMLHLYFNDCLVQKLNVSMVSALDGQHLPDITHKTNSVALSLSGNHMEQNSFYMCKAPLILDHGYVYTTPALIGTNTGYPAGNQLDASLAGPRLQTAATVPGIHKFLPSLHLEFQSCLASDPTNLSQSSLSVVSPSQSCIQTS